MLVTPHTVSSHQVEQFVTVVKPPRCVHHLQPVGIAVQCHTVIGMVRAHRAYECIRVGCTDFVVDVQAIGCTADGDHLGTQLVEHLGSHLVRGAVRGIHHNFETLQGEVLRKRAFAELDISPCCIVQSARFAQAGRICPHRRLIQRSLYIQLPGVGQLGALGAKEFDTVVGIGVVAGTDNHTKARTLRTRQVSNSRGRQRPQQHDVHASGVESRLQSTFQHVARNTGVFSDQHRWALFSATQYTAHSVGEPQYKIWGDRVLAHCSTNTVSAEILACHFLLSLCLKALCNAFPSPHQTR